MNSARILLAGLVSLSLCGAAAAAPILPDATGGASASGGSLDFGGASYFDSATYSGIPVQASGGNQFASSFATVSAGMVHAQSNGLMTGQGNAAANLIFSLFVSDPGGGSGFNVPLSVAANIHGNGQATFGTTQATASLSIDSPGSMFFAATCYASLATCHAPPGATYVDGVLTSQYDDPLIDAIFQVLVPVNTLVSVNLGVSNFASSCFVNPMSGPPGCQLPGDGLALADAFAAASFQIDPIFLANNPGYSLLLSPGAVAAAVDEPATLALLAAGSLLVFRRRRAAAAKA